MATYFYITLTHQNNVTNSCFKLYKFQLDKFKIKVEMTCTVNVIILKKKSS